MGMEATTTVEAWPLGVDPKEKPLYTLTVSGDEPVTKNNEVLIVPRGLEEVAWWSVYKVGTGARLFDTYVPLVTFMAHEKSGYAGVEVPPDDTKDSRLKVPNVVAVLTLASGERVVGEALITCDDAKRAQLLRSFADASRNLTYSSGALRLTIAQSYPVRPLATITVPVGTEGLDIAHAQVPQGMHITTWKR
jgi:hypothetical protein